MAARHEAQGLGEPVEDDGESGFGGDHCCSRARCMDVPQRRAAAAITRWVVTVGIGIPLL
jgi:hypothetical protein